MRSIGVAQRALDLMIERVTDPGRKTFGKYLYQHGKLILFFFLSFALFACAKLLKSRLGTVIADIATSRAEIDSARLLVLSAALQVL